MVEEPRPLGTLHPDRHAFRDGYRRGLRSFCIAVAVLLALVPGILAVTYPDYQGGGFYAALGLTATAYALILAAVAEALTEKEPERKRGRYSGD